MDAIRKFPLVSWVFIQEISQVVDVKLQTIEFLIGQSMLRPLDFYDFKVTNKAEEDKVRPLTLVLYGGSD